MMLIMHMGGVCLNSQSVDSYQSTDVDFVSLQLAFDCGEGYLHATRMCPFPMEAYCIYFAELTVCHIF